MKELILGGVRSGKSRLAEERARRSGLEVIYVATTQDKGDSELAERIQRHRERRDSAWKLIEEPLELGITLRKHAAVGRCILVECLTLWLTNLLCSEDQDLLTRERRELLCALPELAGHIILVSNEVSLGIVPMGPLTRRFIDESGELHQELAAICDRVTLTVAGLPYTLKGSPG